MAEDTGSDLLQQAVRGVGGTVACQYALRSAGIFCRGFEPCHRRPSLTEGLLLSASLLALEDEEDDDDDDDDDDDGDDGGEGFFAKTDLKQSRGRFAKPKLAERWLLFLLAAQGVCVILPLCGGVGGTVACESTLKSAGTLQSRVRAPPSTARSEGRA
ncbi:hypothetical protein PoB_005891800 [Plakobranchus ocellatus]|uniref:Uncharacterized protein n=1 Tax=Plakobranchus ocellatus TaxID=259542 RepID=A0AAV4CMC1_9GAST|nr:hypothetical protein PoB_005891800 [Plakobranchus ocellatus]